MRVWGAGGAETAVRRLECAASLSLCLCVCGTWGVCLGEFPMSDSVGYIAGVGGLFGDQSQAQVSEDEELLSVVNAVQPVPRAPRGR